MAVALFDLDGTLLDTVPLITLCFQRMFRKYGNYDISQEAVHEMFGPGESIIFRREFGDLWETVLADYLDCYAKGHDQLAVEPWMMEILKGLRAKGFPLAIITNKERDTTQLTLDHVHLSSYFDVIVTAQDVEHPKPYPDGILKALKTLGATRDEAIFIGDTMNDRDAAKASNVKFVQALWYVPSSKWPRDPAWTVACSPNDLRDVLASHFEAWGDQ
ncbi:MAG: HAD-IA family hydrolase [Firmicutes bacterium]|nr:HAD-IA family hydrolase [Bacillota bacterium]MCL5012475.1 HAD-IA family hydrolase [Bacillota bacterium]